MIEIVTDKNRQAEKLGAILSRNVALDADLMNYVAGIVDDVRVRGDAALIEYTEKFDGVKLSTNELRVDVETLKKSASQTNQKVLEAIREAIKRIRIFHEHQKEKSWDIETEYGSRLGQKIVPIQSAGLYVPGGTAAYPSSVLMNVIPAQVAGVERIVVVTPPNTLKENGAVSAALLEMNITEIYAVGGAQSIAALAFGTETIPRTDKITGPGNKFVAAAKKLVFGTVGIDSIAGPSEVVIIADETARADYVAADLLAQAEHGEDASSVLITTSGEFAKEVLFEVERQTVTLPRRPIVESSLKHYGAIFVVEDATAAIAITNNLAPEHLEIIAKDDDAIAAQIKHAGAIFLGEHTPEAVGDYFAGPNHVLPTGTSARFSSALGVYDFVKRTSILRYSEKEMRETGRMIEAFAKAEGLDAHARSVGVRVLNTGNADILVRQRAEGE